MENTVLDIAAPTKDGTVGRIGNRDQVTIERVRLRINQVLALALLAMLAPVFLIVALLIWRRDGAPVFYFQYRVGLDGQLFRCIKFRTMYVRSAEMLEELLATDPVRREQWRTERKLMDDPRITPVGHFLRKTSLDELPQLINVLRGEMYLVGPRPITVDELAIYKRSRWHYLSVRPGMTGLWQVSGRNNLSYEERVALDRRYVETRSIRLDLMILLRTVKVVLARDGAR